MKEKEIISKTDNKLPKVITYEEDGVTYVQILCNITDANKCNIITNMKISIK